MAVLLIAGRDAAAFFTAIFAFAALARVVFAFFFTGRFDAAVGVRMGIGLGRETFTRPLPARAAYRDGSATFARATFVRATFARG